MSKPREFWIYDGFAFKSLEDVESWDHNEYKDTLQVIEKSAYDRMSDMRDQAADERDCMAETVMLREDELKKLEAELKRTNLLAGTLIKLKSELTEEVEQLKDENKTLRKAVSYLNTQARKSLECFNELKAENEKLKEAISYLPKIPTQPYEKELAKQIAELKAENEKLKIDLDCEISSHEFTRYHHDGQGVYIDTLAKQNEELKSRIAELEAENEKLKIQNASYEADYSSTPPCDCGEKRILVTEPLNSYLGVTVDVEYSRCPKCSITWTTGKQEQKAETAIQYALAQKLETERARSAKLVEALKEAKEHFDAIQSGLTTDINRVEFETKKRAHAAWVEVFNTLADAETFTTDVDNKFITDVDNEKPELTKPSKE